MGDERLPVLWLCGAPGAGKSAVGWALYEWLARSSVRAGFADIDQLGMCLPAPPQDPERYRLKERNVSALARNFRAAGCAAVVFSGDLGSSPGMSSAAVPDATLTICRLRASPAELRRRLMARRAGPDFVAEALRLSDELDSACFADVCADTDGLTVAEVAALVRERCGGWPPDRGAGSRGTGSRGAGSRGAGSRGTGDAAPAAGAGGDVLLICGATGAGKSAAAFEVFLRQVGAGVAAAYIDLGQIGFISPEPAGDPGRHRLRARNLADLWREHHAAGARRLILSGPVPDERAAAAYVGALPAARVTVCRLHAGPAELASRIARRGQGLSWPEPGDPLIGRPQAQLRLVAARSAAEAEALHRCGLGDLCIDTDGRTVAQVADLIARRWQPGPPSP